MYARSFFSDISPFPWPDPLRRAFPALLGVCALCVPDTLLAAPDSYLDEVVVTATQRAQSVREVPAAASVILREQMDTQGAENVLDSLRDTPGVAMIGRGVGGRKTVSLRGMEGRHTLFLVNGQRIITTDDWVGHSDYQYEWAPLDGVERIEVVRGPMSVLYGSDALGGVVNVITARPQAEWSGRLRVGGRWLDQRSDGDSLSSGISVSGGVTETLRIAVSGSARDQAMLSKPDDSAVSETDGRNLSAGNLLASWEPVAGQRFDLEHRRVDEARQRYDRRGTVVFHDRYDIERRQSVVRWQADGQEIHTQLSLWDSSFAVANQRSGGVAPTRPQSLDEQGVDGRLSFALGAAQWITAGFDARQETMHNAGFAKGKADADFQALYVQDEIELSEAVLLTLGVRHDKHSGFGGETSPRVYLVWHVDPRWTVRGGYGEGFKAPTLKQGSSAYMAAEGPHTFYGNDDIKPETSQSFELGLIYTHGPLDWETTLFHTDIRDLITVDPIGLEGTRRVYIYRNIDQARIQGVESALQWRLPQGFYLGAHAQWLDTEDKNTGQALNSRPEQLLGARVGWASGPWQTHLRTEHTGRQYLDHQRVPAYALWHGDLSYQFSPQVKVVAGIDNLTDVRLAEKSPLFNYTETPRALRLSLHGGF